MEKERFFRYFLLASTFGLSLVVFYMLLPFLTPILWALIFSFVLYPINSKLKNYVRWRTVPAMILTIFILLVIVIPFGVLGAVVLNQAIEFLSMLLTVVQTHTYQEYFQELVNRLGLERFIKQEDLRRISEYIESEEFKSFVGNLIKDLTQRLLQLSTNMLTFVSSFLFKSFVFLITLFFILRDGEKFAKFFERFIPMHREDVHEVFNTVYKTVLATAYGAVAVGIVQGILSAVGYGIAGIKYYPLLGLITFFASFVPPFGAAAVWVPTTIYLFATQSFKSGIFLLLWGALVVSAMDNLIRPLIMKVGIQMPYIVLFFAIVGGLISFGFVGIFLGPIIFTAVFSLFLIYEKRILK
ncbi:AI-2E family transporter [Thermocrinis sp.]